jgi:hypothetical protein
MAERGDKKTGGRGERLAAALRENLKRRKAQAKARSAQGPAERARTGDAAMKDKAE